MANESITKVATVAAKKTVKAGGKASGLIAHNTHLNAWQCFDSNNRLVLSTNSKAAAQAAYPNYAIKE